MTRSISVVLFPSFSNHCLANTIEPLRAANMLSGKTLYQWHYLSVDGGSVASSSGLPVDPERALLDHPSGDMLMVMPSYGVETHLQPRTLNALRTARHRFKMLAGLDTGSWLLAAAGLLDGYRATIHWDEFERFGETFPNVTTLEDRVVIDRDRASCGGTSTALEMMLEFIERDHGSMLRLEVASLFMLGERMRSQDLPLVQNGSQVIDAAAAIMRRNIEEPLPIGHIADQLNLSHRTLENQFSAHMNKSAKSVYVSIRLRAARRMVETTSLSIAEIATRIGYQDKSAMTRAFKSEFGAPPSALRRRRPQT